MKTVNIYEAKTHLSRLLEEVAMGEEIVIARAGKPVARLVPWHKRQPVVKFGTLEGRGWISGDVLEPLPEDIIDLFYNGPIFPEVEGPE